MCARAYRRSRSRRPARRSRPPATRCTTRSTSPTPATSPLPAATVERPRRHLRRPARARRQGRRQRQRQLPPDTGPGRHLDLPVRAQDARTDRRLQPDGRHQHRDRHRNRRRHHGQRRRLHHHHPGLPRPATRAATATARAAGPAATHPGSPTPARGHPPAIAPSGPHPPTAGAAASRASRRVEAACRAPPKSSSPEPASAASSSSSTDASTRRDTLRILQRRALPLLRLPAPGRHRVSIRVTFERGSGTPPVTLTRTITICARPAPCPALHRLTLWGRGSARTSRSG